MVIRLGLGFRVSRVRFGGNFQGKGQNSEQVLAYSLRARGCTKLADCRVSCVTKHNRMIVSWAFLR